jgi:hypothetical protein
MERHHELPARPSVEHYRKGAKELLRDVRADEPEALERAADVLGGRERTRFVLSDAQFVIAQEHGFRAWADFRRSVEAAREEPSRPVGRIGVGDESGYDRRATALVEELRDGDEAALRRVRAYVHRLADLTDQELLRHPLEQRDARLVVAREYGFRTWRELVRYTREAHREWNEDRAPRGDFALALQAIRDGDAARLEALLEADPELVWRLRGAGGTLLGAVTQPDVLGTNLGRELGVDRRCIELLIEAGSELDGPLNLAACFGRIELMEMLLAAGADGGASDIWGITALASAVYHGQAEAADVLVPYGVVPDTIWVAAATGLVDRVAVWFDGRGNLRPGAADPRPNLADVGWPPGPPPRADRNEILAEAFVLACFNGRLATADQLLERGVDVNARPYMGMTGLHFAAVGDKLELAGWLLDRGIDPSLRNDINHDTAAGWAEHAGHRKLAALVRSRGGSV